MKPRYFSPFITSTLKKCFSSNASQVAGAFAAVLTFTATGSLQAASDTWSNGGADNNWQTVTNWASAAAFPGAVGNVYTSADDATFSATGAGGAINLGGQINLRSVIFGAAGGDAAANVIGSAGNTLNFTTAGGVTVNAGVTTAQTIGAAGTTLNLSNASAATATLTNNGTGLLTVASNVVANGAGAGTSIALSPVLNVVGTGNTSITGTITKVTNNSLFKNGTGTLTLSNGSIFSGAGAIGYAPATAAGYPLVVRQGTLLLNGGTHSITGETVIGGVVTNGGAGQNAKIQIDSGTLAVSGYLSIGRGNGIGGVSSDLVANNGAIITAANFSAGYNGAAGNLPKGTVTLNNTSSLTVTGNGAMNLAESGGSNMTMTLNNSAQLTAAGTAVKYIGQGGTGVLNINPGTAVSFGTGIAYIGFQAGNGTVNMSGGAFTSAGEVRVGGSATNGTAQNGTGTWNLTGGTATVGSLSVARGNNNQNTVSGAVTVGTGATLNAQGDVTLGYAGNNNLGKLTVSGGTLNVGTTGSRWFQVGAWDTAKGQLDVTSGSVNILNSTPIRMSSQGGSGANVINQSGGVIAFYSDAGTTVGGAGVLDLQAIGAAASNNTYNLNGGSLVVPQVKSSAVTGTRTFNFNGGTLKPTANNAAFLNLGTGNAFANVRNSGANIDSNGFNITIPQALIHSNVVGDNATDGGLTKSGSGTLALSGANTYTGATTVTGGTLQLSGAGAINASSGINVNGSGAKLLQSDFGTLSAPVTLTNGSLDGNGTVGSVTVADSATNVISNGNGVVGAPLTVTNLTLNDAATLTLSVDPVSGLAPLTTGTLTTGAVDGAGKVTVNASSASWLPGQYDLISYTTLGGVGYSEFQKGTVTGLSGRQSAALSDTGTAIALTIAGDNPIWTGAAGGDWTTGSAQNWALITSGTATAFQNNDIVLFDDTAVTSELNIAGGNVSPASTTFINNSFEYSISSVDGYGIAAGSVTLGGIGGVAINNANTYAGGTLVNSGTLKINHASAIGSGALSLAAGSMLDNTSGGAITLGTANAQNWNGDFNFVGTNDLNLGTGAVTLSATRTVTTEGSATLGVGGAIGGTGFGLTKVGTGTLALSGANTYTGVTTVNAGTLEVTGSGSINAANTAGAGQVTVGSIPDSTGTLHLSGTVKTNVNPFNVGSVTGATGIVNMDGGTLTASGEMWLSSAPDAHGTFNLSGGAVTTGGWLAVGRGGNDGNLNVSGGTVNVNGGNLAIASFAGNAGQITVTGGTVTSTNATFVGEAGTGTLSVSDTGSLVVNGTAGLRLAALAAGTGTVNLGTGGTITTKIVSGTGASTFNFNGGTLKAGAASATFLQGLTAANVQSGGALIDSNGFAITIGQALSGDGGLSKSGSGTLTLSATNTYAGNTTINGGTLNVTGAVGAVTVASGTLDGTGYAGAVTVADGAGNAVANGNGTTAALTTDSLTFNDAATLNLKVSSTAPAIVTNGLTTGAVDGAGKITVNISNASWVNGETYNLISYGSLDGVGFSEFQLGTVGGLTSRQVATLTESSGTISLTISGDLPVWSGGVDGEWSTATIADPKNWKFQASGNGTDFLSSDTVLFNDSAIGATAVNIAAEGVSPTSTTFNNSTKDYTLTSSGSVGIASGFLLKEGTGSVTLASANTYPGGTTVNDGTLNLNAGSVVGAGALAVNGGTLNINNAAALSTGALTLNGGALGNTSGADLTLSTNNAQNWNGDFAFNGTNSLNLGTGAVTLGGVGSSRTVTVNSGILTAGEVTSTTHGLIKQGAGTLLFTTQGTALNASRLAGDLDVQAGTVQFNATGVTGGTATTINGDLYVAGLTGSGTVANGAGQERWLYISPVADSTFAGALVDGAGGSKLGFYKDGASTQTLSGANTLTGTVTVNAGKLTIAAGGVVSNTNTSVVRGTAILEIDGGSFTTTAGANAWNSSLDVGAVAASDAAVNLISGSFATSKQLVLGNAAAGKGTFTQTGGTASVGGFLAMGLATGTGVINQSAGSMTIAVGTVGAGAGGSGTINLSGDASFTNTGAALAELWIGENGTGVLNMLDSAQLNHANSSLIIGKNATGVGTVNLNGGTILTQGVTKGAGSGTLNINGGTLKASAASATFLTGLTAVNLSMNGVTLDDGGFAITVGQALGGNGPVAKNGAGVTTLSGANTYTGATLVNVGTLNVTGSLVVGDVVTQLPGVMIPNPVTGQPEMVVPPTTITRKSVTVAAGATLGGTGTIAGSVDASGAIAPGVAGVGTLATGEVTVAGSLAIEVNGAAADKVASTGAVHLSGALSVTELAGGFTEASYVIAEGTSLDGTFSSVPEGYSVAYTATSATLTKLSAAGYDSWATTQGLDATNNGPTQDPDGDGIANALEFALGGNALASDQSILPVETLTETDFIFTFNRADDSESDVTLSFEAGSDLAAWPTTVAIGAVSSVGVNVVENDAAADTVTVTIPRSSAVDGKLFGRLKASK